jgi:cytochrome c-type biogenesis protein CcmH
LIASALLFIATTSRAAQPSFQEVEESLTCQCGCGLTVHSCNHLQCPSAIPLRQEIREQLALGKDRDLILAHFADKYGEKILSSPTTKGFNLTAWVMPFVAVGIGGGLVVLTLVRWRRSALAPARGASSEKLAPSGTEKSPYEKILERELKGFDA